MANSQDKLNHLFLQAQHCMERGDAERAIAALDSMLAIQPDDSRACLQLAGIAFAQGRLQDASRFAISASSNPVPDAGFLANLIMGLLHAGDVITARKCLTHSAISSCRDGSILAKLASAQQMIGNHPAALELIERAFSCGFDNPDLRYLHSVQLSFNGQLSAAEAELEAGMKHGTLRGRSYLTLSRLRNQTIEKNHLPAIDRALKNVRLGSEDHAAVEFAHYKESEDVGDFAAAWDSLQRANAIMRSNLPYDASKESRKLDGLMSTYDRVGASASAVNDDSVQPIFIVGMPRSGTTLLDRMLGNHPMVESAGELSDFARQLRWCADLVTDEALDPTLLERMPRLDMEEVGRRYLEQTSWRAMGKARYIDKLPANYVWSGFIARALPGARIVHLDRDPMDVCFSNYRAYFGAGYAYSYDTASLAAYYRDYRRLMKFWRSVLPDRILDVPYNELVANPETTMKRVFKFCGITDVEGQDISDLSKNRSPVATLSTMQVRGAIDKTSGGHWKPYERHLQTLMDALANIELTAA